MYIYIYIYVCVCVCFVRPPCVLSCSHRVTPVTHKVGQKQLTLSGFPTAQRERGPAPISVAWGKHTKSYGKSMTFVDRGHKETHWLSTSTLVDPRISI